MLVPGLLLLQFLWPRDWIQARKKSLQGWRVGGERNSIALDTYIIRSRQMESLLRPPIWSTANEGDSGQKWTSMNDRRAQWAQPVASVRLKVDGVNIGEGGKGRSQYHDREGVQFPQQHRNREVWRQGEHKGKTGAVTDVIMTLMEEIKMQLQEWQEQRSEEMKAREENKYRWQGIARFSLSITLSMSYYIWNILQFDKLALTSVILWIHIFIYWKQRIFLFTAKFSGS